MDLNYEEKYHKLESENWWFLARRSRICDMLRDAPRNASILDIGCASGHLLQDLKKMGFKHLTGIDVSKTGVEMSVSKGFNCFLMDGQDPRFDDNSFDIIISSDSLEHMEHDRAALKSWHKILRPGGLAIVFVPAFMSLWSGHDVVNHHYRRYKVNELVDKSSGAGFIIMKSGYWNFFLFLPVYLWRKIKSLFESVDEPSTDNLHKSHLLVNLALKALLFFENKLARFVRLPIGVSAFVSIKKQD